MSEPVRKTSSERARKRPRRTPSSRLGQRWAALVATAAALALNIALVSPADALALNIALVSPADASNNLTFFVDSVHGNDANSGRSPLRPWRSLTKASSATQAPGTVLLLRRGGLWTDGLRINASGTAKSPINIAAYGAGPAPLIRTSPESAEHCVVLAGDYIVAQGLHTDACGYAGFRVDGDYVSVLYNWTTHNVAGVEVGEQSQNARVLYNDVVDNNKMAVNTPGGNDDSGAFGILLHGLRTEVAYNTISGSHALSQDYGTDGGAVEIYQGRESYIHHNLAVDNETFAELGHRDSRDNTFAYNVVISRLERALGLVTRGPNDSFGPVTGTKFHNNSIYLTGARSEGFVCYAGCDDTILDFRNNIVQAVLKTGYSDGPVQDHNVYFGGENQFTTGPHDVTADPRFRDPAANDLRLLPDSPAIDRGAKLGYRADFDGNQVPVDGDLDGVKAPDSGAYEYRR